LLQTPIVSVEILPDEDIVVLSPTKLLSQSELDFFNVIGELDTHNIDYVQKHSKAWFDLKDNLRRQTVDDRYSDIVVGKDLPRIELPMFDATIQCYDADCALCDMPTGKFDAEVLLHLHTMRFEQKNFQALIDIAQVRLPKPHTKKIKRTMSFGKSAFR